MARDRRHGDNCPFPQALARASISSCKSERGNECVLKLIREVFEPLPGLARLIGYSGELDSRPQPPDSPSGCLFKRTPLSPAGFFLFGCRIAPPAARGASPFN